MNRRMIINAVGLVLRVEAVLLLLPAIVGMLYGEKQTLIAFLISAAISLLLGLLPKLFLKPKTHVIYAKEAFTWIMLSLVGAVPLVLAGAVTSYADAFFEIVSGFTTTGSSVIPDVEVLSHGALFWRSFTHWVGGMGIIVFVMAILPNVSERPIHILRAEIPGPTVGKLVPRIKDTALILYLIYIGMTVIETIMLLFGGMSFFESLLHAFGTAGTGGFGIKRDSIAGYSPYIQWVITVFMVLFGVNFNVYYFILIGKGAQALKGEEFRAYIGMVIAGTLMIALNILPLYGNSFAQALHQSFFQVSSIISTTGFATADFDKWPELSRMILMALLISGASAGSTAGGIKVARIVMLFKGLKAEVMRAVKPRRVVTICMDGKRIDASVMRGTYGYVAAFVAICAASMLLVSLDDFDFTTTVTGVLTCIGNVGPGLSMVGPSGNFSAFSDASKLVLSLDMLFGRLEIFPLILMFSPRIWGRRG